MTASCCAVIVVPACMTEKVAAALIWAVATSKDCTVDEQYAQAADACTDTVVCTDTAVHLRDYYYLLLMLL